MRGDPASGTPVVRPSSSTSSDDAPASLRRIDEQTPRPAWHCTSGRLSEVVTGCSHECTGFRRRSPPGFGDCWRYDEWYDHGEEEDHDQPERRGARASPAWPNRGPSTSVSAYIEHAIRGQFATESGVRRHARRGLRRDRWATDRGRDARGEAPAVGGVGVSGAVFDTGALIAIDRGDRAMSILAKAAKLWGRDHHCPGWLRGPGLAPSDPSGSTGGLSSPAQRDGFALGRRRSPHRRLPAGDRHDRHRRDAHVALVARQRRQIVFTSDPEDIVALAPSVRVRKV